jgi:tRNA-uridine 2-sulfurtransferase
MSKGPIVIAMSGGVDSSVAAYLLKEDGYEPVGLFMNHGTKKEMLSNQTTSSRSCCSITDSGDAAAMAYKLDIPFYTVNYSKDFNRIKEYFAREYRNGRTPIPCIPCNQWVKFGSLIEFAHTLGINKVATGHYARIEHDSEHSRMYMAEDLSKDQTYFMMGLKMDQIKQIEFPLGRMKKSEVRKIAESIDMSVHNKPDSQEICFVPGGDYRTVLRGMGGDGFIPGNIVDLDGNILGKHDGIENFTVGQRKGLGIYLHYPVYVHSLNPHTHDVTVAPKEKMFSHIVDVADVSWIEPNYEIKEDKKVLALVRYNRELYEAKIRKISETTVQLEFLSGQFGVQGGQAAVWYESTPSGTQVLGGGWIEGTSKQETSA